MHHPSKRFMTLSGTLAPNRGTTHLPYEDKSDEYSDSDDDIVALLSSAPPRSSKRKENNTKVISSGRNTSQEKKKKDGKTVYFRDDESDRASAVREKEETGVANVGNAVRGQSNGAANQNKSRRIDIDDLLSFTNGSQNKREITDTQASKQQSQNDSALKYNKGNGKAINEGKRATGGAHGLEDKPSATAGKKKGFNINELLGFDSSSKSRDSDKSGGADPLNDSSNQQNHINAESILQMKLHNAEKKSRGVFKGIAQPKYSLRRENKLLEQTELQHEHRTTESTDYSSSELNPSSEDSLGKCANSVQLFPERNQIDRDGSTLLGANTILKQNEPLQIPSKPKLTERRSNMTQKKSSSQSIHQESSKTAEMLKLKASLAEKDSKINELEIQAKNNAGIKNELVQSKACIKEKNAMIEQLKDQVEGLKEGIRQKDEEHYKCLGQIKKLENDAKITANQLVEEKELREKTLGQEAEKRQEAVEERVRLQAKYNASIIDLEKKQEEHLHTLRESHERALHEIQEACHKEASLGKQDRKNAALLESLSSDVRGMLKKIGDKCTLLTSSDADVSSEIQARTQLLAEMEMNAKKSQERSETEAARLQGALSSVNGVMEKLRNSNKEDRERLSREHTRIETQQASLLSERNHIMQLHRDEREKVAHKLAVFEEEKKVVEEEMARKRLDIEQEKAVLRKEMADFESRRQDVKRKMDSVIKAREQLICDTATLEERKKSTRVEMHASEASRRELMDMRGQLEDERTKLSQMGDQLMNLGSIVSLKHDEAEARLARAEHLIRDGENTKAITLAEREKVEAEKGGLKLQAKEVEEDRRQVVYEQVYHLKNRAKTREAVSSISYPPQPPSVWLTTGVVNGTREAQQGQIHPPSATYRRGRAHNCSQKESEALISLKDRVSQLMMLDEDQILKSSHDKLCESSIF